jgi:hypothetical protein
VKTDVQPICIHHVFPLLGPNCTMCEASYLHALYILVVWCLGKGEPYILSLFLRDSFEFHTDPNPCTPLEGPETIAISLLSVNRSCH